MTESDYKEIKNFVIQQLKDMYSSPTISLWFEPMKVVSLTGNTVTVSFPQNRLAFVETQYFQVLKEKF